jgi:hypothetical protein
LIKEKLKAELLGQPSDIIKMHFDKNRLENEAKMKAMLNDPAAKVAMLSMDTKLVEFTPSAAFKSESISKIKQRLAPKRLG